MNETKGNGLGLAVSKELKDLLGGQITVESDLNKGTTFIILLPINNKVPKIVANPVSELVESSIIENTTIENNKKERLPLLLIIEDNRDINFYLKKLLSRSYQLEIARDGHEGVEKASQIHPNIILCDVLMPIKNGFEVCELLKKDEQTKHIPIILLTAKATDKDKILGLRYGADAWLTKPFDEMELKVRLKQLVLKNNPTISANYQKTVDTYPEENGFLIKSK